MKRRQCQTGILTIVFLCISSMAIAQNPIDRLRNFGSGFSGGMGGGSDTLAHRSGLEDSVTISFRYLDSSRYRPFDSSITDFSKRFPIPASYISLGNTGSAARSILFNPLMKPGWDAGFHA